LPVDKLVAELSAGLGGNAGSVEFIRLTHAYPFD